MWYNKGQWDSTLGKDAGGDEEMFNKKKAMKTQVVEVTCSRCGLILEIAVEPGAGAVVCVCDAEIALSPESQQAA